MNTVSFVTVPGCDFEICTKQVTQAQWQEVMGSNPSHFKGSNLPVEMVSWNDCQEFLKIMNDKQRKFTYRLPTDEEWKHCFGKEFKTDEEVLAQAWCYENSESKTHVVGSKQPNEFGIYDMRGNVWEWCADMYSNSGSLRVIRGGGWFNGAWHLRSAQRDRGRPGSRSNALGFRLIRNKKGDTEVCTQNNNLEISQNEHFLCLNHASDADQINLSIDITRTTKSRSKLIFSVENATLSDIKNEGIGDMETKDQSSAQFVVPRSSQKKVTINLKLVGENVLKSCAADHLKNDGHNISSSLLPSVSLPRAEGRESALKMIRQVRSKLSKIEKLLRSK